MAFSIGNTVKFLNNIGGGTITKIISKELMEVETPDGFRMPILANELILMEEEIGKQKTKKPIQEEEYDDDESDEIDEIQGNTLNQTNFDFNDEKTESNGELFLAFVPQDTKNLLGCDLDIFLINDTDYYLIFNYLIKKGKEYFSKKRATLEPNTKMMLDTVKREHIHQIESYLFQILKYKKTHYTPQIPLNTEMKINTVKFFKEKSFADNDFFDEASVIIKISENQLENAINQLTKEEINKLSDEKNKAEKKQIIIKSTNPAYQEEVTDLHLHELIDDETGLSPKDKLDLQMNKFRTDLNSAISRKIRRIVFIHGKGNGVLKQEIKKELQTKYKQLRFQDASFQEYGYGATMVIIRN